MGAQLLDGGSEARAGLLLVGPPSEDKGPLQY